MADYFLRKPALIKEGSTEQELMDGIELSFIGAYRGGNTEFSIYFAENIYVTDLHIIVLPDGQKEISYMNYDREKVREAL